LLLNLSLDSFYIFELIATRYDKQIECEWRQYTYKRYG
jgi:hypothetical protein